LARGKGLARPASTLDNVFAAGAGEEMRGAIEALEKNADRPALKLQVAYSMPKLAALQRKQGVDEPAGADPTGTILEITCELVELSPAALSDELFAVPAGFSPVSLKEITSAPAVTTFPAGQFPPGFTPPVLISRTNPQYTAAARKAKIEGTVAITMVVDAEGNVRDPRIVKSLRPDLDQKAIEAVSQWKFRPGEKDGKPVAVASTIQINFRLLEQPPDTVPR
jgi:TonB family protein